ncbi:hypothetical protein BC962_2108 [Gillisia mitskevichiae]|uniref:Cof subfamily protein (Haloacid dehalogenase superfamily)/HAD superfamily hydrolase (TIGR01484 family) n=1 Tax=Gillisia mitskevichiae TaxID=270921 RepID=A0A495PYB6_9FLAO|nr:HAD family hydrolase [Gillisia mitskevichiae]RKS53849.1 hypothetical protein BC962_2108 [Gillisia mitskevichiae]
MKYKIIFSDIDGTLLNKERQLSVSTISEIKKLKNKIPFILISARMPAAMRHLQKELEIEELPIISYNGGLIIVNNVTVSTTEIPVNIIEHLNKWNTNLNCHLSLYHNDEWYVPSMDYWAKREENNTKISPNVKIGEDVIAKWKTESKGAHKIMAMGEVDQIDQIVAFLSKEYPKDLHLYRSKSTYLEISPKSISKLTAIKYLLEQHFNFTLNDVIAYGDNYNDVEMLNHVGFGVAVGNAREEAKLVANHITALSIEDGVAKSLQKLIPLENW